MQGTRIEAAALCRMLGSWASSDVTMPESLAKALMDLIDENAIPAGSTLPPQRELARSLSISRGTVTAAINILDGRGYTVSIHGSGTRVRSGTTRGPEHTSDARMFSFTNAPAGVIDLSTGALPASDVARRIVAQEVKSLGDYLMTDGYFPAGLPLLRKAVADRLTHDGIPTRPSEILITAGAQQATQLAVSSILGAGDTAVVEDPTYRGALAAIRRAGARIIGIPMRDGVLDISLGRAAMRKQPELMYCQTGIHNPTGQTMPQRHRKELAETINSCGIMVVEDACSYNLTLEGPPARTLAGLVDPEQLVMVGTLSKLFWGGIRVGWLRASAPRLRAAVECRKVFDLAGSLVDQLLAVRLLEHASEAMGERRAMLRSYLVSTAQTIGEIFPEWSWATIRGGTAMWVDTHGNSLALVEHAKRVGVRLTPGPSFSPYEGHASMLRIPLWHEPHQLKVALERVRAAITR